jgi:hypothetical protein
VEAFYFQEVFVHNKDMKKTPRSASVYSMAKDITQSLNGNKPNRPKPTKATDNFDKIKYDMGSSEVEEKNTTLVHLLDSVDFNMNHGYNHVMEAKQHAEKAVAHMKQNPQMATAYASLYQRIATVNKKLKRFQPKD